MFLIWLGCSDPVVQAPAAAPAVTPTPTEASTAPFSMPLPDVAMVDHLGQPTTLRAAAGDGLVALQFIFTTCTVICPPMGAVFEQLQALAPPDARLLSITIDPETDTPARLAEWGARFHAGARWNLYTGEPEQVRGLLRTLKTYAADIGQHAPVVLLGHVASDRWLRVDGLGPAATLASQLADLEPVVPESPPDAGAFAVAAPRTAAHQWFTDVPLVDQAGTTHRLYTDLIEGNTVVVSAFYTDCKAACPVTNANLTELRKAWSDRPELRFVSISLDPEVDTQEKVKAYAASLGAPAGWSFLTGDPTAVRFALHRLGLEAKDKETHSALLMIGNDRTGLWKKALGMAPVASLQDILRSVVEDKG